MTPSQRRLELYVLLESLNASISRARSADGASRAALRAARDFLSADAACVAVLEPGDREAREIFSLPAGRSMDRAILTGFILERHPEIPPTLLMAPLRRHGRPWGVMALARRTPFAKGDGQALSAIAAALKETIARIERERILEVRSRIDRKIMEELRPKDLFYQILDGLRSLTRYDHSSALLIRYPGERCLRLEAEQIAWQKSRSHRIGQLLDPPEPVLGILEEGEVYGFDREGPRWTQWHGHPALALAELLDSGRPQGEGDAPAASDPPGEGREAAMLCATLSTRGGAFGVLKIAARHPGSFGVYDAETLDGFRSQAAIAIQNSLRTESLQARMLEAERKHAMADLARGISHDVNNALGAALPLVQKMRADVEAGDFDAGVFAEDLGQVLENLQHCRHIFGGMLGFARRAAHGSASGDVARAARASLSLLQSSLDRRRIHTVAEIPGDLPAVVGGQSDLERIFFNLLSNARDATPDGGRLSIRARTGGDGVEILIEDSGRGIPAEDLPRVQEPFFTTKEGGNGLGLSICRSLLWQMNGDLGIESQPGRGTRVRLRIPRARIETGDGPVEEE